MVVRDSLGPGGAGEEELPPEPQRGAKQLCYLVSSWFSRLWGIPPSANRNTAHSGSGGTGQGADGHKLSGKQCGHLGQEAHVHTFLRSPVSGGCTLRNGSEVEDKD